MFTMAITLYTSRIMLKILGKDDIGVYNVVGSIVTMFGFINGAMTSSSMRYITYELGRKNFEQLKKVFCTSVYIHIAIALLILILSETFGLWFLYNKMNIAPERLDAAFWVFQSSLLSAIAMFIYIPYNSIIIAHEKMGTFAYISILDVMLKLFAVAILPFFTFDRLILYAFFMLIVHLTICIIYVAYSQIHFKETKLELLYDGKLAKEILAFSGWNLWGGCASVASSQGINILLNIFFTPAVNAARYFAIQAQSAVTQFTNSFQTAVNPQIIKSYAAKDFEYMHKLIYKSSQFTYFLLMIITLPILFEIDYILKIWLVTPPEYTSTFVTLTLISTIIIAVSRPLMIAATATGKVRLYQSIIGGLLIMILPVSYVTLKLGGDPYSVFIVTIILEIIALICRLIIIKSMINLSIYKYIIEVIVNSTLTTALAIIIPFIIHQNMTEGVERLIAMCITCTICNITSIYVVGLNKGDKHFINSKLKVIIAKVLRK